MVHIDGLSRKPCANPAAILFALALPRCDLTEDIARRAAELRPGPQPMNAGITPTAALEFIHGLNALRAYFRLEASQ